MTTAPVYVFYFSILWRLEPGLSVIVQEAKLIRMGNIRECQARDNRQKDCCSFEHDSTDKPQLFLSDSSWRVSTDIGSNHSGL